MFLIYFALWTLLPTDFMKVISNAAPLYERFNNVHHGFMKALKMRISFLWVLQKFASRFTKAAKKKHASPLHERFSNVHHGFVTALKTCIAFLWAFQNFRSTTYEVHKKPRISFVRALQQCPSRFYEGLKNAHRPFMSLSKVRIALYESHKNMHFRCMTAWTMCITVLRSPWKCASPYLWVLQKFAPRFTHVIKKTSFPWY